MEVAKIQVTRADAQRVYCDTLTAGMVGAVVTFSFDSAWDGLRKTAVFKAGQVVRDVLMQSDTAEIPPEVLARPHSVSRVGVYGTNGDGTLIIPTVWADLGEVTAGADPSGDPSTKPTLPVWQQILNMIGDLAQLNTATKENLVAAVNEALTKGGGEADPEEIQRIVQEYLEENATGGVYVGSEEPEDPNVDIWIDPEGESVDIIPAPEKAKVGQTIRVKEVDAEGKPIAWEAADLPSADSDMDVLPAPAAAEVGQYFRVSAVDESGKVTAVESVDAPSGGGGDVWRLIRTITIPADVAADTSGITWFTTDDEAPLVRGFAFDLDDDGNAFEIEDYKLYGMVHMSGSNGQVYIGDITLADNLSNYKYRGYRVNLGGAYSSLMLSGNRFGDRVFPTSVINTQYQPVPVVTTFTGGMPENNLDGTYPVHDLTSFAIYSEGQTFAAGDVLKLYGKEKKA